MVLTHEVKRSFDSSLVNFIVQLGLIFQETWYAAKLKCVCFLRKCNPRGVKWGMGGKGK